MAASSNNDKAILYYDDVSPPVRSCLMLIKMLDIDVQLKHVDLFKGEQFEAKFLEVNPIHTVPTLVHRTLILTDSHAILMYLAENCKTNVQLADQLWPKEAVARLRVLNMLFFECSVLFRRDSDLLTEIVRKGYANTDIPRHERKIMEAYDVLEKQLKQQLYMITDHITLADLSLVTTLSTLQLIFPLGVEKHPLLGAWLERMKSLPAYEINSCGLQKLCLILAEMGKFQLPIIS